MEDQNNANKKIALAWKKAWGNHTFRIKTITGSILLLAILIAFPYFFTFIEQRKGIQFNDHVLSFIPAVDVSLLTFIIIWSMTLYFGVKCFKRPDMLIVALYSFIILCLSRMLTIGLFPLNPPLGLIPLRDPIVGLFYGGPKVFITKDLFYSGHTATQFLMFLCLRNKNDKILALLTTTLVGILVLVQHVHYTVDVVAAIILTYFIHQLGKRIARY